MSEQASSSRWSAPRTRVGSRTPAKRSQAAEGPRRRQPRASRFVTKREMKGGQMNVPSNPPSVHYQPWFQTTIVHSGLSGGITITVKDLISQLVNQLDPHRHGFADDSANQKNGAVINIRIRSIRAWNITGRMIALSVDDFSDADKAIVDVDALCGIVDTGSAQHIPAVGYELPESHRNIVLRNGTDKTSDTSVVVYHVVSSSNDSVIIYTNVYWKFDGPAKFSSFHNQMLASVQNIEQNTIHMERHLEQIADQENKSGYGDVLVNGIKKVAPFVIPTAALDSADDDEKEKMAGRIADLESRLSLLARDAFRRDSDESEPFVNVSNAH